MKLRKPLVGIVAFIIVLLTMPLGHAVMILMEKAFGHKYLFIVALLTGLAGIFLLMWGFFSKKELTATLMGLFGGLLVWTGWIEFAFVYYANRFGVEPLMQNGEIVTKPEYLIMPSSVGFWAVIMIYYLSGTRTGCRMFTWLQKKLKIGSVSKLSREPRNVALSTFMEINLLLWTFYMVLLFTYDPVFAGDRHPVTYFVAFVSLLWSMFLFIRLIKISNLAYAIRYSIPTVIIFWNFIEILGRWNLFSEIWIEPEKYWLEISLMLIVLIALTVFIVLSRRGINGEN